jgi:hypothetical protein
VGVMKRQYTERMLRAPAPAEMPDVVALPRCECGCRRWTLNLEFGTGRGKRAHSHVGATCSQCGASRRVHEYHGQAAATLAAGRPVTSRTNQTVVPVRRQHSGTRATALVGHATDNRVASGLCFDESSAEKETSPKQSSSTRLRSSPGRRSSATKG